MNRYKLLLLVALLGPPTAYAQQKVKVKTKTEQPAKDGPAAYAASITPADLRRHLTELASDAYEGRATGEKGQKMAAEYLTRQFTELGLAGPVTGGANGYQQPFGLLRYAPDGPGRLRVGGLPQGGRDFAGGRDFVAFGPSPFLTETPAAPVFLGFGIETDAYNDYAGQPDVKGKDIIVLQGEPTDGRGHYLLSGGKQETEWSSGFRKAALARDKGARSVIVVTYAGGPQFEPIAKGMAADLAEPAYELLDRVAQPLSGPMLTDAPPPGICTLLTSLDVGAALLGTNAAALGQYVLGSYEAKRPLPGLPPQPFRVHLPQQRQELTSENVLGYLEGTDKKDEVLVVSAHYDHVGVQRDTIYNGADDDGSGTVAVLELAQAFSEAKKAGKGPRRSVLFLLNSGEERGLLGSEYYTGHPLQPLAQTVSNLNIDMIGRSDARHKTADRYLYLIGSDKLSSQLHALSEEANARYAKLKLDYFYNRPDDPERLYYRSDHYNFARHGIPVIFYTSGLHADYHKATDDVEKIEFDKLAERARLVFYTAWELANREARPVVDSNKP